MARFSNQAGQVREPGVVAVANEKVLSVGDFVCHGRAFVGDDLYLEDALLKALNLDTGEEIDSFVLGWLLVNQK